MAGWNQSFRKCVVRQKIYLFFAIFLDSSLGAQDSSEVNSGANFHQMIAVAALGALLIYFISVRPNRKQSRRLHMQRDELQAGDEVLTSALWLKVVEVNDKTAFVQLGGERVEIPKFAIFEIQAATNGPKSGSSIF